jgi:C1A family cysteine protease
MRKFCWLPDPPKAKDFNAVLKIQRTLALPLHVSLRNLIIAILDQGRLGSCVTNAIAQVWRAALIRAGIADPFLASRLFLYYFARALSGSTQRDAGTYIRAGFDIIRKLGAPREEIWPYSDDLDTFRTMPSATALHAAYDQRAGVGYYRISEEGADRIAVIQQALAAGFLVVFGTQVSNRFQTWRVEFPPLTIPGGTEAILGGHALVITGYDARGPEIVFEILNSWGPGYGDAGYTKFTAEYIAWEGSQDFWIVEALPNFSEVA